MSSESSFDRIDHWMGKYYESMGRDDYFDENGIGKFKAFVDGESFEIDDIGDELEQEADCGYVDFVGDINDFPFSDEDKTKGINLKQEIIFRKILECYENTDEIRPIIMKRQQTKANFSDMDEDCVMIYAFPVSF